MNIVWMNIKNGIAARQEETAKSYSNLRKNFLHKQVSFQLSILPYRLYQMELLLLLQSVIELQQLPFGVPHLHQALQISISFIPALQRSRERVKMIQHIVGIICIQLHRLGIIIFRSFKLSLFTSPFLHMQHRRWHCRDIALSAY